MNMPEFMRAPDLNRRTPADLHAYQNVAIKHQCSMPHSNLWLDMGLGKTVITLTSIAHLRQSGWLKGVLIVAPLNVVDTVWEQQAKEWTHTAHLTFSRVTGNPGRRLRQLTRKADVYLINYDNLAWLAEALRIYYFNRNLGPPFDGVVWDEISRMKRASTLRVRSALKWLPYTKWRTGLTGTPASNGYLDLHGQYKVLDLGTRLGTDFTSYKSRWFDTKGPYKLELTRDSEKMIHDLIADITIEMSEQEYLRMPPMITNDIWVTMPQKVRVLYEEFEANMFTELESGTLKEVFNAAAKTNSCLQISNGAVYLNPGEPEYEEVHDLKLDALDNILEEAGGQPVLVAYAYKSDAERITKRFKKLNPVNLTKEKDKSAAIAEWQAGNVRLMLGHPRSMGHGTDGLQRKGNILVWFGPNWSLELVKQFNARLRRQGQGRPVICHRILTTDTLDEAVIDALDRKDTTEKGLRAALRRYRKR